MFNNNSKVLPISCICSIYKKTYLDELTIAIDSLMLQEFIPDEIIIIVDGIIKKDIIPLLNHLKNDKDNFKVFHIQENKGLGFALKYGLTKCKHEIVARFDSDDINLKDRLRIQYDFLEDNPNIAIVGSDIIEFNKVEKYFTIKKMSKNIQIGLNYMVRNPLNHPTVVFRKKDIIKVGSYKNITYFEDYELWLRCIKKGLILKNINETLVAMKRTNLFSRRHGLKYALCEFRFLFEIVKQGTIKQYFIPLYILRILIRLLPSKFAYIFKLLDKNRKKSIKNPDIDDYIFQLVNNPNSFSKRFI